MCSFIKRWALLFTFSFAQSVCAQETAQKYFFKEIGWTIILPSDFRTLDSSETERTNNKGKTALEESNDITIDVTDLRTLIAARKDQFNYFNSTIRPFNPVVEGKYDSTSVIVKELLYKTFVDKMPGAKIDSVTTTETIDGLLFDKFHVTITLKDDFVLNLFLLSKYYKGYDFGISYLYIDEKTRQQIESMLMNSTFKK